MSSQGYYDGYWTADGFNPPHNTNSFLEGVLSRYLMMGTRVADLGCGDGRTIGDIAVANGSAYVGVDLSSSGIKQARERGLSALLVQDVSDTGLESDSFDVVFLIEVLEHLVDPYSAVREARRLLAPQGVLIVTVPNAAVWPRRLELLFMGCPNAMGDDLSRSEPWRDPHLRSFTVRSLRSLLSSAGLEGVVEGTEPVFPGPKKFGETAVRLKPSLFARRCVAEARAM